MINDRNKPVRGLPPKDVVHRPTVAAQPQYVVAQPTKSVGLGIVLAILFGPIG